MPSHHYSEVKRSRRRFTFPKSVWMKVKQERQSSLCSYCGVEHGNEKEHILPVAWAMNEAEALEIIEETMGKRMEVVEFMKSTNNCAQACARCNFEKRQEEDNCFSIEAKKALVFKYLAKAKRWDGERWVAHQLLTATGKKRSGRARKIAYLKGRDVYERAHQRRAARGRKTYK